MYIHVMALDSTNTLQNERLPSIDILRGLVIVIMALDHTRDFFSAFAGVFEPTDLTRTSTALFLTRWITHFCAPVFVFLAGLGSYLAVSRGRTLSQLSSFLLSRGLWLILLEVLIITPFGWSFRFDWSLTRLQVIWVIGASMIILGALAPLGPRISGLLGLAIIATHNLLDGSTNELWRMLHSITFHRPTPGHTVASLYPLIPWVGVMMAGYGAGPLWNSSPKQRQLWLNRSGLAAITLFFLLRLTNLYGDPSPFQPQQNPVFTLLSFVNVSKYPPSLDYLLLTLGPAALLLAALDRKSPSWTHPFQTFGRVPLFFYLLHLPLIHGAAVAISLIRHGSAAWLFQDPFALRRPPNAAPVDYGFGLLGVYLLWLAVSVLLYPLCLRYGQFKRSQRNPIWSYL
jgi:uncharacterized membrane protein